MCSFCCSDKHIWLLASSSSVQFIIFQTSKECNNDFENFLLILTKLKSWISQLPAKVEKVNPCFPCLALSMIFEPRPKYFSGYMRKSAYVGERILW